MTTHHIGFSARGTAFVTALAVAVGCAGAPAYRTAAPREEAPVASHAGARPGAPADPARESLIVVPGSKADVGKAGEEKLELKVTDIGGSGGATAGLTPPKKAKPTITGDVKKSIGFATDSIEGSIASSPEPPPAPAAAPRDAGPRPTMVTESASRGVRISLKGLFKKKSKAPPAAKAGARSAGDGDSAAESDSDDAEEDHDRSVARGPEPAEDEPDGARGGEGAKDSVAAAATARVRKEFPEALFFAPEIVTAAGGHAKVKVALADTVTDWRVTMLASSADGRFGDGEGAIHVFQPFFLNVFAPRLLVQGDVVTLQIGVFNYLTEPAHVKVTLATAAWFEATSPVAGELDVPAGSASAFPVTVRILRPGTWPLRVTATSPAHSDAVEVPIVVEAGGVAFSTGGVHSVAGEKTFALSVPASALPEGRSVELRVYGGDAATLRADLDSFVTNPTGCLEQTLSRMDANLAALRYLEATGAGATPLALTARRHLRDGYMKLLTHKSEGAFALYPGKPTGDDYEGWLGVRALELLRSAAAMKGVTIDPALVTEIELWAKARYLASFGTPSVVRYDDDGRPITTGGYVPLSAAVARALRLPLLSAARARFVDAVASAPPYTVALVLSYARRIEDAELFTLAATRLRALVVRDAGGAHWTAGERTLSASYGDWADLETTAIVAAELLAGSPSSAAADVALGGEAVAWLLAHRAAAGGWGTTSASARAVEAVAELARLGGSSSSTPRGDVVAWVGTTPVARVAMPAWGEVASIDLGAKAAAAGKVRITVPGAARVELGVRYRLPYADALVAAPPAYRLDVLYGDLELKAGELVPVIVRAIRTGGSVGVNPAVIRIPVAGTMSVDETMLERMVKTETIDRFERDATGVTLYVDDVDARGVELRFAVRAVFPGEASTGVAEVYEYYHPASRGLAAPAVLRTVSDTPR